MSLDACIERALAEHSVQGTLWIALSGGCDSVCLLHLAALARQRHAFTLQALHVHHGLQAAADTFAHHCQALCAALEVPLTLEYVTLNQVPGGNIEAQAREARYAAFARHVRPDDVLWLAHHQDDQAETLLLRLMRGAGVTGLGAMPATRLLGEGRLLRPLLAVSRAELRAYAEHHGLGFIDDPTNDDERFDRNYLRHRVLPILSERWPAATARLAASARHAREADALLDELAALDLERLGNDPARLPCDKLQALSSARQRLLIRYCLVRRGLPLPAERRLATLIEQIGVGHDKEACVDWPGAEGRIWRHTLFLRAPCMSLAADWQALWDGVEPLRTPLGGMGWRLWCENGRPGITLRLTSRRGGERLRQRGMSRKLKTLLQQRDLPPWQRERLVLAWYEDVLVAVLGETCALLADGWQAAR